MMLAPSRLLPLSGSNLWAFSSRFSRTWKVGILWFVIAFASCSLQKKPAGGEWGPYPPKKADNAPEAKVEKHHRDSLRKPFPALKKKQDSMDRIFPEVRKEKYMVLCLQPFYLNNLEEQSHHRSTISAVADFYKGFLIAADTLKKCGISLDIHWVDSENPVLSQKTLADSLHLLNVDLMIGPILEGRLTGLDSLAAKEKVNYISPVPTFDECRGNPYYFESFPSSSVLATATASYIKKAYPRFKYFLLNEKNVYENPLAFKLSSQFNKDSLNIISYTLNSFSAYNFSMDLDTENVFFITSSNETFVSAFFAQLRKTTKRNVVIGNTSWLYFNGIEGDLWEKFGVTIPSPFFFDFTDKKTGAFLKAYRNRFQAEPSRLSFIGYDELLFYSRLLRDHGRYFQRSLPPGLVPMLHTHYQLEPDRQCGGWKNKYVDMLKFENYQLNKVTGY